MLFHLIDSDLAFLGIYLVLSFYFLIKEKNTKPLTYFGLAILISIILKPLLHVERPCMDMPGCPDHYGFPSGHTLVAFMFAFSLKEWKRVLFILIALIVAYSRYALGMHTIEQLTGTVVLSIVLWQLLILLEKRFYRGGKLKQRKDRGPAQQSFK